MTTAAISRRRKPRGRYPKTQDGAVPKRQKRVPEYLEADEVNAIIRAAPSPKAKLLMLEQWRAGLRVSEALDLGVRDLSLDTATPTLRAVRQGRQDAAGSGASGAAWGARQCPRLWRHQPRQNYRGASRDSLALGAGGGETCRGAGRDCAGETCRHSHAAAQLCPAPADERHPDQLPLTLAGALVDSDDAHLPGASS